MGCRRRGKIKRQKEVEREKGIWTSSENAGAVSENGKKRSVEKIIGGMEVEVILRGTRAAAEVVYNTLIPIMMVWNAIHFIRLLKIAVAWFIGVCMCVCFSLSLSLSVFTKGSI